MERFLHSFLGYYYIIFMCISFVEVLSSILTKGETKNGVL